MEITLNGQSLNISEKALLSEIVFSQIGEKQKGIAVALNNTVIPKSNWQTTALNPKDTILIIKATQGG